MFLFTQQTSFGRNGTQVVSFRLGRGSQATSWSDSSMAICTDIGGVVLMVGRKGERSGGEEWGHRGGGRIHAGEALLWRMLFLVSNSMFKK